MTFGEDLGEEQYGSRRGVGMRDSRGMLRVGGERYIEKNGKAF